MTTDPTPGGVTPLPGGDAERLFSQLFNMSPFPAVVSRLSDHTILAINLRTSELIGIPQEKAVGLPVGGYYADDADRGILSERVRRDGRADNVRIRVKRRGGEPFWALVSAQGITWRGEPALLTIFHDLTSQLAAERALQEGE